MQRKIEKNEVIYNYQFGKIDDTTNAIVYNFSTTYCCKQMR